MMGFEKKGGGLRGPSRLQQGSRLGSRGAAASRLGGILDVSQSRSGSRSTKKLPKLPDITA